MASPTPQRTTPGRGIRLGSIRGAQILIQPSTLLMLLVLAFIYSGSSDGQVTPHAFSLGMLLAVLLFVSVFIHELAHAIAAWAFGRKVNTIQLTLWGGVTSFDGRDLTPKVSGVTAIAGPFANAVVALGAWTTLQAGILTGTTAAVVQWLVWANVRLAVFNVLPGIPMDGGKVLQAVVWSATGDRLKATRVAGWSGRVLAVVVVIFTVGYPVLQGKGVNLVNVAFAFLLFSVIWPSASAAIRAVDSSERRESASVATLMLAAAGVPYTATVGTARDAATARNASFAIVLAADGAPAGVATMETMNRVPEQQRQHEGLQSVTTPLPRGAVVASDLAGEQLIERLREWYGRTDSWAVMDGDEVVGVVRLADVLSALQ
jgi:Zn-dependent protease